VASNAIFFGWNRSIPGREQLSAQHFQEFVQYLGGLEKAGRIASFEPFFLDAHGGDMNGGFLIRGEPSKLDAVVASTEWITHMMRAQLHLQSAGAVRAVSGPAVGERMALFTGLIPK
jgi:hypothetical protein